MEKILAKFYDDQVDFEAFILIDENDIEKVLDLLEAYRKDNEEYNWDGFVQILCDNKIKFEKYPVENIYF